MSLIPSDQPLAVAAALFAIAGAGFLLERTRIGALLTGTVWTILLAILAANLRVIPFDSPAYDFVFAYFVPVLIPLFLMKADLRRIFFETSRTAAAFLIAAMGTVAGAFLAAFALDLGPREAAVAGSLTASYTGGSVNFAALVDTTGLADQAPSLVSAIVAADHLASALFLGFLALAPGFAWLADRFVARDHSGAGDEAVETEGSEGRASAASLALSLAFALIVVATSDLIVWAGDRALIALNTAPVMGEYRYLVITALALIPATLAPRTMARLDGGFEIGVALSFVFFAAIAAGANIVDMITVAPMIMAFIVILISVHAVVVFAAGSLFRLSLPEIITASNAAILGATTAPALAAAKGWRDLVTPGVLAGVLGYALGTFLGVGVFQALG